MFTGFELTLEGFVDLSKYEKHGRDIFDENKAAVEESLDRYMLNNGAIDGTKMQNDWFPQVQADVFVSHSHVNETEAIGLAGFLYKEMGLRAFIDSCVWGYSNELLQKLDNEYCKQTEKDGHVTYGYNKRNYSTSHVHMMLATALTMMIDNTECIMFLTSPESLTTSDFITRTISPWIYHEIAMTKLVRKRSPNAHRRKLVKSAGIYEMKDSMDLLVSYVVDLGHLHKLSDTDLAIWKTLYQHTMPKPSYSLDVLYNMEEIEVRYLAEPIHE